MLLWDGDPGSLVHLGTFGNAVFRFDRGVLRLTDPAGGYRTLRQNELEILYVEHLAEAGVRVTRPIRSSSGAAVVVVDGLLVSAFQGAPGEVVRPRHPAWGADFVAAWGRALASIHLASPPPGGLEERWAWADELFLDPALFDPGDVGSRRALEALVARLSGLPTSPDVFGWIHQDFAPQNFHFDPVVGVTAFDFGNACRHWFVHDLVVSLSVLRRRAGGTALDDALLGGYRELRPISDAIWAHRDDFLRLRRFYWRLSRQWKRR